LGERTGPPTGLTTSGFSTSIAVYSPNVYLVFNGGIYTLPITAMNTAVTPMATKQNANDVAIDTTKVYWTTSDGTVVFAAKGSTGSATVLVTGQTNPGVVTTDGANLY